MSEQGSVSKPREPSIGAEMDSARDNIETMLTVRRNSMVSVRPGEGGRPPRPARKAFAAAIGLVVVTVGLTVALLHRHASRLTSRPMRVIILSDWHSNPHYNANLGRQCYCSDLRQAAGGQASWLQPCELSQPASRYGQYGCAPPPRRQPGEPDSLILVL